MSHSELSVDRAASGRRFGPPATYPKVKIMSDELPPTISKPQLDNLPPVTPPSAGFILQLFVVPALIVLAVIAASALFGRLASGEQDWRVLTQEMESTNPHVYRRAMFGLAQLLEVDRRLGEAGQQLAQQREVAEALTALLSRQLSARQTDEETLSAQVYLVRSLGLLDVPDVTLPALDRALNAEFDVEVQKGALTSIALIAGRALDAQQPLPSTSVPNLLRLAQSENAELRRAVAFALGLFPDVDAQLQLAVLLDDSVDEMTSVNAAIALARSQSTQGYAVFLKTLAIPTTPLTVDERQDRILILRNSLRAMTALAAHFSGDQRQELQSRLKALIAVEDEVRLRVDAQQTLSALELASPRQPASQQPAVN